MKKFVKDRAGQWHLIPWNMPATPAMKKHQIDGVEFMAPRRATLLASEPGTGKTAQMIELINRLGPGERALIVCPSGLRANWMKELAIWLTTPRRCKIVRNYVPREADVVLIHYDALVKFEVQLRAVKWGLLCLDEAHALKNWESIKAQQVLGGAFSERLEARQTVIATATPMLNRPAELWPLLAILGVSMPRELFEQRFCDKKDRNRCWDEAGLRALVEPFMLRQRKADVLDLPPKVRRVVAFEPTGAVAGAVCAERTWRDQCRRAGQFAGGVAIDKLSALRKATAELKIQMVEVQNHLKQAIEDDGKIVVFCHHREIARKVAGLIPMGGAVIYSGDKSSSERDDAVVRFQTDERCCMFVGTLDAGGVGITLTAARRMIFIEEGWTPAVIEQAEDRIHRIGQTREVLIEHVVIKGSVDAREIELQIEKQTTIDSILNRRAA